MTPKQMAEKVVEHLAKPAVRRRLAKEQAKTEAYFKELRKKLTPTYEDLHRPFDI